MSIWFHGIDIVVFLHSLLIYGRRWTFIFFILGFSLGLCSEHVGTTHGWIFGRFHYQPDRTMFFGTVPVLTPIAWWLVIYCAYNTTNLIFGDLRVLTSNKRRALVALFIMASLDGLMAMNLDMLFDPIMVSPGRQRWVWETGGAYFNIPIQNFVGWFFVAFTVSLLIRIYDIKKGHCVLLGENLIHYVPVGIYFCMCAVFGLLSYMEGYPQYTLIGFSGMMPFVLWASVRAIFMLKSVKQRRGTAE